MGTTLIVIFVFGLVITGIVLLGVQQAADWAKADADQRAQTEIRSNNMQVVLPTENSPLGRSVISTNRP